MTNTLEIDSFLECSVCLDHYGEDDARTPVILAAAERIRRERFDRCVARGVAFLRADPVYCRMRALFVEVLSPEAGVVLDPNGVAAVAAFNDHRAVDHFVRLINAVCTHPSVTGAWQARPPRFLDAVDHYFHASACELREPTDSVRLKREILRGCLTDVPPAMAIPPPAPAPAPMAVSPTRMARRFTQFNKQVSYGKTTRGYRNYVSIVPITERMPSCETEHPVTPRFTLKMSKRERTEYIRRWRRALHRWDHRIKCWTEHLPDEPFVHQPYG
jgi:hypothetical protein